MDSSHEDAIVGSLLGGAVGDALGLPYEGISRRRGIKMLGPPERYRFLLGRGMVSDDTEHASMVAQALIASGCDPALYARELARRLRWWLLSIPAGIGLATLKACIKLCVGVSAERSGVYSAGNGPAMRAPILGAAIENLDTLRQLVRVSTRITHTDPKAEYGAWAVALAARSAAEAHRDDAAIAPRDYANQLRQTLAADSAEELVELIDATVDSIDRNESTEEFAATLKLERGVTGYMYHTVPIVLHAWLRHPRDLDGAIRAVIRCGGDTDTTAAIVGGIVGCTVGREGVPQSLLDNLYEWPRSVSWLQNLGERLAIVSNTGLPERPPRLPAWGVLARNFLFAVVVLLHGFRRLAPPY